MRQSLRENFKSILIFLSVASLTAISLRLPYDFSIYKQNWSRPEGSMPDAWYSWFTIHIVSGMIAVLLGLFQVFKVWRKNSVSRHKKIGILYVLIILFIGAPSGYYLAAYSIGGFYAFAGYTLQSTVWWVFTLKGALYARNADKSLHKVWMERSLAVSLSPITLRLLPYFLLYFDLSTEANVFPIVAWASWTLNLALYEMYRLVKSQRAT